MFTPRGFTVAIPTLRYELAPTEAPDDAGSLRLAFQVPNAATERDHLFFLNCSEASPAARLLIAAAAGALSGEGRASEEIVIRQIASSDEGGPVIELEMIDEASMRYALSPERARALGEALDAARCAFEEHPPRLANRVIGTAEARTSEGTTYHVVVDVDLSVSVFDQHRIKLEAQTGTWWIDDEVPALAAALAEAAKAALAGLIVEAPFLSLDPPPSEALREPWLSVALRRDERGAAVVLRLYDDMVQERREDGFIVLSPENARTLAGLLEEALRYCAENPAHVEAPPKPGERIVASASW